MSVQFVDKMITLIESGECVYKQDKETIIPEYDNTIKPFEYEPDIEEAATILEDEINRLCGKRSVVVPFSELDWTKFKTERKTKKNKIKIKVSYPEPKQPHLYSVLEFLKQNYSEDKSLKEMAILYIDKGFADELIKCFSLRKTINAAKEKIISEAKKNPELSFEDLPVYLQNNSSRPFCTEYA